MARRTHLDDINKQNEEHDLAHNKAHSTDQDNNSSLKNNRDIEHEVHIQPNNIDEFDPFSKEKSEPLSNEMRNKQFTSDKNHNNEATSHHFPYDRSISMQHGNYQQRPSNMPRTKSCSEDSQNNQTLLFSATNESEKRKSECNDYCSVSRLLEPNCEGIRERIELLGELLRIKKLDTVPIVYDEMAQIVEAMERNQRLKAGLDGERLIELTTRAKSNLNIDLHNLDVEIQRQFGLYSVEVTGDGACAFRAILISAMQQPDLFHIEMREKAIQQVRSDTSYYSTVLIPGDRVSNKELEDWAQTMYDPNTYGDEMANIAVADRYHIQLVIFRAGELLTVVNPRDGLVQRTAFLVNVGTHYKALVPKNELDQARKNSERLCK